MISSVHLCYFYWSPTQWGIVSSSTSTSSKNHFYPENEQFDICNIIALSFHSAWNASPHSSAGRYWGLKYVILRDYAVTGKPVSSIIFSICIYISCWFNNLCNSIIFIDSSTGYSLMFNSVLTKSMCFVKHFCVFYLSLLPYDVVSIPAYFWIALSSLWSLCKMDVSPAVISSQRTDSNRSSSFVRWVHTWWRITLWSHSIIEHWHTALLYHRW